MLIREAGGTAVLAHPFWDLDDPAVVEALVDDAGFDGVDADWATWYSDWLVNLSKLAELVGTRPVRSELTSLLVGLDKEYVQAKPTEPWEEYYATALIRHFRT